MISFYPGPSRVHDEVPRYVKDAHHDGILSMNHRSDTFVKMSEKTIGLLKRKLTIPRNYTVFFTSSATECWEIIAQSLIQTKSYHLYNGSFGQKWFDYTHRLHPNAEPLPFGIDEELDADQQDCNQEAHAGGHHGAPAPGASGRARDGGPARLAAHTGTK